MPNDAPRIAVSFGLTAGRFTSINFGSKSEPAVMFSPVDKRVPPNQGPEANGIAPAETVDVIMNSGSQVMLVTGTPDFPIWPREATRAGMQAPQWDVFLAQSVDLDFGRSVTQSDDLVRHGAFREVEMSTSPNHP